MKNKIVLLILLLLTSGCSANEIQQKKKKQKDFSYLKIQKVLSEQDKRYYENIHNQISEIGKHFAYREEGASEKYCPILNKMFYEISSHPFSRERERERERERVLLQSICFQSGNLRTKYDYKLLKQEFLYLSNQIPSSASLKLDRENSLWIDSEDLVVWKDYLFFNAPQVEGKSENANRRYQEANKDYSNKQEEYCKKAIETMQWDHIYYISNQYADTGMIINILKDDSIQNDPCVEVLKLALQGWSKKHLYSPEMINPTADEFLNPNEYSITQKELRDWMKKRIGRDLDKEPKVKLQQY